MQIKQVAAALRNVGSSDDAYRHRELHCVQHSLHHLPEPFGVALWGDGRYLANCMYIDHGGRWHQSSVAIIMRDGEITNKSECLPLLWKITEKKLKVLSYCCDIVVFSIYLSQDQWMHFAVDDVLCMIIVASDCILRIFTNL